MFVLVLLLFFAALPAIAVLAGEEFYIGQFRRILIFAIAAVSLDLILGYGGMVSFGHAAFFGIGAYVVGILNWHAQHDTALLRVHPGRAQYPGHLAGGGPRRRGGRCGRSARSRCAPAASTSS